MTTDEKLKSIAAKNGNTPTGSGMNCVRSTYAYLDSAENMKRRAAVELELTRKNAYWNRENGRNVRKYMALGLERVAFYRRQAMARAVR